MEYIYTERERERGLRCVPSEEVLTASEESSSRRRFVPFDEDSTIFFSIAYAVLACEFQFHPPPTLVIDFKFILKKKI